MTLEPNVPKFSGLNRRLVDEGNLTAQQMQAAIDGARKNKKKTQAKKNKAKNEPEENSKHCRSS